MEIKNNVITFKSLPCYYDKEKSGIKNNTVRCLLQEEEEELCETLKQFKSFKIIVKIVNTETGESFSRVIRDISRFENLLVFTWDEKGVSVL